MSVDNRVRRSLLDIRARVPSLREAALRVLFGDRLGLTLFVTVLVVATVIARTEVFITDNYTLLNALVALSEGHLAIERAPYGALNSPGMHVVDGQLYGRNYGQVVTALPLLWLLEAVAAVADPRIALSGAWSLLILAGGVLVGRITGHERPATVAGSLLALGAFGLNAVTATPLAADRLPVLALQIQTLLAAGFLAVLLYRLTARIHGRRVGLLAGAGAVLGTPVLFWASVPKRHVVMAALTVAVMYCLYRSRESDGERATLFRAGAYGAVGLSTWVHAPEALALFVVLVAVDLPTGRRDPRALAIVAVVFGVSLLPMLITNTLIGGSPIEPPRLLPNYDGGPIESSGGGGSELRGSGSGSGGATVQFVLLGKVLALFSSLTVDGIRAIADDPGRLVPTFLRSGYVPSVVDRGSEEAINLSILESAPVIATLAGLPVLLVRRIAERDIPAVTPARVVDGFVLGTGLLYTLLYMPRLPLHAQVTVRYLLILFPLGVYGLVRLPAVRTTVREAGTLLAFAFAGATLVGGQVVVAVVAIGNLAFGEALQLSALLGLGLGAAVAVWSVVTAADRSRDWPRVGALALGSAFAGATVLAFLVGVYYVDVSHVLPAVQWLLDAIPVTGR